MFGKIRSGSALILALLAGGCYCTADYRFSDYAVALRREGNHSPGDTLRATFGLDEWRGSTRQQSWSWFIDLRSSGDSVIEARIIDPAENDPDRRVLGVLTGGYYPYRGIYRSYGSGPYTGSRSYDDFWDMMAEERLELEVITAGSASLRGKLMVENSGDWHPSCTD